MCSLSWGVCPTVGRGVEEYLFAHGVKQVAVWTHPSWGRRGVTTQGKRGSELQKRCCDRSVVVGKSGVEKVIELGVVK
jgi:hypothetical protein